MQLNGLTEFTLILTLAFVSESLGHENWTITIEQSISVKRGSDKIISCKFNCPPLKCDKNVQVHWKKRIGEDKDGKSQNRNEFVYHNDTNHVVKRYRNKTELIKNGTNDCSLRIRNITDNDQDIYVRLQMPKTPYSFYDKTVLISVFDRNTTSPEAESTTKIMYMAIFVPVSALVIAVVLTGIFCFMKRKRKQPFTREESGYYANFSRPTSNNAKSDISCKKIDSLPEINDVEDPVYANVKGPPDQMDQSIDNTNNIYANVNYSR